jgi:hypothetical protein
MVKCVLNGKLAEHVMRSVCGEYADGYQYEEKEEILNGRRKVGKGRKG